LLLEVGYLERNKASFESEDNQVNLKMADGFAWIFEKHSMLMQRVKDPNEETHHNY
jgi:hypothetical protein